MQTLAHCFASGAGLPRGQIDRIEGIKYCFIRFSLRIIFRVKRLLVYQSQHFVHFYVLVAW